MTVHVRVPGSKSMTQRALVIAALAERPVEVWGALESDDSRHLTNALRLLGTQIDWNGDRVLVTPEPLHGTGQTLYCGNAGTAVRFTAALSLVVDGSYVLDGDARMRERPIGDLGDALTRLGVEVEYLGGRSGVPPVRLRRGTALVSGETSIDGSQSSQFISALIMAAPRLQTGLRVRITGPFVSRPYLRMTMEMMRNSGAIVEMSDQIVDVVPGRYFGEGSRPSIAIEPDWSSASFVLGAGRILGIDVVIDDLAPPSQSVQGDAAFESLLAEFDRPRFHSFDLGDTPDLIAPIAAVALFVGHPTEIRGAGHTRIKESDRIAVLATELRKAGARIEELPDGLTIHPLERPVLQEVELDPANDHRMAMAFGLVSLRVPQIKVLGHGCVTKSFPGFWQTLDSIRQYAGDGTDRAAEAL